MAETVRWDGPPITPTAQGSKEDRLRRSGLTEDEFVAALMALRKRCHQCKEEKQGSDFYLVRTRLCLSSKCRDCAKAASLMYYKRSLETDPESVKRTTRNSTLLRRYGITSEQFEEMRAAQNNGCHFCGSDGGKRGLYVDHDHDTGEVRKLLCARCNTLVGFFETSTPELIAKVVDYVRRT